MSTDSKCPQCHSPLRIPEALLGKQVKCPRCSGVFLAGAPGGGLSPPSLSPEAPPPEEQGRFEEEPASWKRTPAAPPPEAFGEKPRSRRWAEEDDWEDEYGRKDRQRQSRAREDTGLAKVRTGVTCIVTALLIQIGSYILLFCSAITLVFAVGGRGRGSGGTGPQLLFGGMIGLVLLFLGVLLLCLILQLVGEAFCVAAPSRYGAKPLAIAVLLLSVVGLLLSLSAMGVSLVEGTLGSTIGGPMPGGLARGTGVELSQVLNLGSNAIGLIHTVVFLFFLRAVARCVEAEGLARQIVGLLVLGAVMILGIIGVVVLALLGVAGMMAAGPGSSGGNPMTGLALVFLGGACLIGILGLAYLIWYIIILFQVRGAISAYLRD